jgi:hypothetical protein
MEHALGLAVGHCGARSGRLLEPGQLFDNINYLSPLLRLCEVSKCSGTHRDHVKCLNNIEQPLLTGEQVTIPTFITN